MPFIIEVNTPEAIAEYVAKLRERAAKSPPPPPHVPYMTVEDLLPKVKRVENAKTAKSDSKPPKVPKARKPKPVPTRTRAEERQMMRDFIATLPKPKIVLESTAATPRKRIAPMVRRGRACYFEFEGRQATLQEWARQAGLPLVVLRSRINQGWSFGRALTTPHQADRAPKGSPRPPKGSPFRP